MRILIIGFAVFVIWTFFSTWLYISSIWPALNEPIAIQTTPEPQTSEADSLAQIVVSPPNELMIYFEFDKSEFKSDPPTDISLAEFKNWLDKYQSSMLSVTGHADFVGTSGYNQALGLRRALSTQKYFEEKGIPAERIKTDSKGEDQPLSDNQTAEGRAKNRRTEVLIKKQ